MRVQIILLDLRWFRSPLKATDERGAPGKERYLPDPDPRKTMLGSVQWEWLADQLFKPAEIRLIVSSTQVLAEGHGWERWGNMPLERQKLIDTIRHSGAKGVLLLSGDRHVGALYRETPPSLYPLYEVTSSGLNMVYWAASEPGPNRVGALYPSANFGVVDIDWWEYKLTLALRDEGGNTRRAITLGFDDLLSRRLDVGVDRLRERRGEALLRRRAHDVAVPDEQPVPERALGRPHDERRLAVPARGVQDDVLTRLHVGDEHAELAFAVGERVVECERAVRERVPRRMRRLSLTHYYVT